jgi:hypothetical protein
MNFGEAVVLLFAILGTLLLIPDLLGGIVSNEQEIRTAANLIGYLVAMIPFTSEEIMGLIIIAGVLIILSKSQ